MQYYYKITFIIKDFLLKLKKIKYMIYIILINKEKYQNL